MYRVYLYYLRGSRQKDFPVRRDALDYAKKFLRNGKIARVAVEDIEACKVIFEAYSTVI